MSKIFCYLKIKYLVPSKFKNKKIKKKEKIKSNLELTETKIQAKTHKISQILLTVDCLLKK